MTLRVQAAPPQHYGWLAERIGIRITPDFRAIEAVDEFGHIKGMVGYEGWTDNSCQMHVAIDSPMVLRHILRPAFAYPFLEAGRGVVLGSVPAKNAKAVKLDQHLGFREIARVKDGFAVGNDIILFEMRKEVWLARQQRKAA